MCEIPITKGKPNQRQLNPNEINPNLDGLNQNIYLINFAVNGIKICLELAEMAMWHLAKEYRLEMDERDIRPRKTNPLKPKHISDLGQTKPNLPNIS